MKGMSVQGKALSGIDHLYQSLQDIATTPIGTRVMRREYGSEIPELMDRPMTPALMVDVFAALAKAYGRWEPRFRLTRIEVVEAKPNGSLVLDYEGIYLPDGKEITLEGIVI